MSGAMSKRKGAAGERELANFLTERGHPARRGQQYCGANGDADVICPSLEGVHIECKRVESFNAYKCLDQAAGDAGGKMPVVFHRRNGRQWIVVLNAEDLLRILDTQG